MTGIGPVIRRQRQRLNLTMTELARMVGCSKAYLSAIENDKVANPPRQPVIDALEKALQMPVGQLTQLADWHRTPPAVRSQMGQLAALFGSQAQPPTDAQPPHATPGNLDALYHSGALERWLADHGPNIEPLTNGWTQVPIINKVAAGYPTEFTDLAYPARVADEYIPVPGPVKPDAFAARVCGRSMEPKYHEGDIVMFSGQRDPQSGDDCFVRLLPDHHTTFKRVFFEADDQIRLQPLNADYPATTHQRDEIDGLYPAIYRIQAVTRK